MRWSTLNGGIIEHAEHGHVLVLPKRRKLAIVCNHPLTRALAPLNDPTWEIWALNSVVLRDQTGAIRADRWFELHPLDAQTPTELRFLEAMRVPVYMFDVYPAIPMSVRFPIERVERFARFGRYTDGDGDLFSCTMAYQLALALAEGYRTIGLWGVELDRGSARERTVERMALAYWCGVARGLGVHLQLPRQSTLLTHPRRYGYEYQEEISMVDAYLDDIEEYRKWERGEKA